MPVRAAAITLATDSKNLRAVASSGTPAATLQVCLTASTTATTAVASRATSLVKIGNTLKQRKFCRISAPLTTAICAGTQTARPSGKPTETTTRACSTPWPTTQRYLRKCAHRWLTGGCARTSSPATRSLRTGLRRCTYALRDAWWARRYLTRTLQHTNAVLRWGIGRSVWGITTSTRTMPSVLPATIYRHATARGRKEQATAKHRSRGTKATWR